MSGYFLSCSKGVKEPLEFQRLGVISLETPLRKWASSRLEGKPPGFSRVAAGALDLRRGPQGPALVASGKDSPMQVARGSLGNPLPSMPGPKTLCGVGAGT